MSILFEGFIIHSFFQPKHEKTLLFFIGRLKDGKTFAIVEEHARPGLFVRASDKALAVNELSHQSLLVEETQSRTIDGEPCYWMSWNTPDQKEDALERLKRVGVRTYEADLRLSDQYRLNRNIHGSVKISAQGRPGRRVDWIFKNPRLLPSLWHPELSLLSFDIETDSACTKILAIAFVFHDHFRGINTRRVLFVGPELGAADIACFADERSLLVEFQKQIIALDPDIITGWNIVDFDFRIIAERFRHYGMALHLGRSEKPDAFLPHHQGQRSRMIVTGRQVLDGIRLLRATPERYPDYSLDTVAHSVLGYGKEISLEGEEKRIDAIDRLYREDPLSFCYYCLKDAELVDSILEKTGLLELTLRKCQLIGISLDRAWTSIPAFEFLYMEAMHERGIVAPTYGVDAHPLEGAPGGVILAPKPGVYDNVMVFDFKSLYPSIIRTFNIDPLSYIPPYQTKKMSRNEREKLIQAPNGACFRREPSILPQLLDRFFESRDLAKERGDHTASYVYKIIMNSFYGVLGASGCRFAASGLAGAITSFGHHILHWCKTLLTKEGYNVLYGDTDSLFVELGKGGEVPLSEIQAAAKDICLLINSKLAEYLRNHYDVDSQLVLEFEKGYGRFFLPPLRGDLNHENGQPAKGRSKGYAGLLLTEDAPSGEEHSLIEVKGMEAVRRDWTGLAQEFQIKMLDLLFKKAPLSAFQDSIQSLLKSLYAGELDDRLVYTKALRKPISAYTRNQPPHVRAASLMDASDQRGLIHYIITRAGPQPVGKVSDPIDYKHYIERQLKPIAWTFTEVLNTDIDHLMSSDQQLSLF